MEKQPDRCKVVVFVGSLDVRINRENTWRGMVTWLQHTATCLWGMKMVE